MSLMLGGAAIVGTGIKEMVQRGRERRQRRRERQQTGLAAPEIGRDFAGTTEHLAGGAATAGANYGADRGAQGRALGLYAQAANGGAPSAAQNMLAQQSARNVADFQSAIAGSRGGNLAGQGRMGAGLAAASQMGAQNQIATLRAQEMEAARAGMAGLASNMAGVSAQQQMGYEQGLQGMQGAQLNADLAQRGLNVSQIDNAQKNIVQGTAATGQVIGNIAQASQTSDERLKTDIQPGNVAASQAVGAAEPYTYQYKSPAYGAAGTQTGVMAQDLEKTPAGAAIVQNTPVGKVIDVKGGMSLALAASSDQEHRIRQLEEMLKKKQPNQDGGNGLYAALGAKGAG